MKENKVFNLEELGFPSRKGTTSIVAVEPLRYSLPP
jgi:hypothetical protein